jgi:hypothetical protein
MRHFFSKSTVEAVIYCKICHKDTLWKVAGGRPLYCTACYDPAPPARVEKKTEDTQGRLF